MTAGSIVSTTGNDTWATDTVLNSALYDGQLLTSTVWLRTPSSTPLTTGIYIVGVTNTGTGNTPVNNYIGPTSVTLTQTWQQFQVSGTAPNGLVNLILQVGGAKTLASGAEVDVWGAELIQNSPVASVTNILPYSQDATWPTWLFSGATITSTNLTAPDGSSTGMAMTASSTTTDAHVTDSVQSPGQYSQQTVTASIYLKGSTTLNLYLIDAVSGTSSILASSSVTLTSNWQRFQLTGTTLSGTTGLTLQIGGAGSITSNQVIDLWGAQMVVGSIAGQYVATLDSPVTATADSTNILPSSTQVGGHGWYVYNGTVAANSVVAPDGTATADTMTATAGSTAGFLYDSVYNPALYDGATVTGSIYLRAANTPQSLTVSIGNSTASGGTTVSTLNAAVTTTWQRFDLPPAINQNGLTNLYLSLGSKTSSQLVSTNPIYIWGAQMEMGTSPGTVNETNNTGTNGSPLATNGLNESYAYDSFGNMLQAGNFNFVQSYTTANQLSGWSYDASGNLLIDGQNNGYAYDGEGRISAMGSYIIGSNGAYTFTPNLTYLYDAEGNRVEKSGSSGTDAIYFEGRQLARLSGGLWTDLIYGVGGLLAEVPEISATQSGQPVYRMTDHLGSVVGTLSYTGVLQSSLDYAPFGQIFAGGTADPYVFTGKERDTESGNDYFGARYYASSMGRFMTPDWSAKIAPVPYAKLDDPQTLNLYSYARNNPSTGVDADGHSPYEKREHEFDWVQLGVEAEEAEANAEAQASQGAADAYGTQRLALLQPGLAQQQNVPSSNRTFKSADAAATAGLDSVNGKSNKQGVEYGGRVFQIGPHKFGYTLGVTQGHPADVDVDDGGAEGSRIPAGTTNAGIYHTHPSVPDHDAYRFSYADVYNAHHEGVPNYVERPDGSIVKFDFSRTPSPSLYDVNKQVLIRP